MTTCDCAPASCGREEKLPVPSEEAGLTVAMATIPMQPWETPYDQAAGLRAGTIFPCLDKPFYVTGGGFYG